MAWHEEGGWFHRSKNHVVVRSTGRAIHHTSKAVHRLLALGTGILVVLSGVLAAGTWRLAQGPIDFGRWSDHVRAALGDDTAPVRLSFDRVFLAWEGFHKGVDHPLDLRLANVTITDPAGRRLVVAPAAHLTFSLAGLLLGRIVPRDLEVDHAQIALTRESDGAINFGGHIADKDLAGRDLAGGDLASSDSVDLRQFREQLSRPASSDHGRSHGLFDQIQRVHFQNTEATLRDQESGLVIATSDMDLDLVRAQTGHIRGVLQAPLSVGDQQATLTANANWVSGSDVNLEVKLTSLRPAGIGVLPSRLAFMAGINVPVSLTAAVGFDTSFQPYQVKADIQIGQGQIQIGQGSVPIRRGTIALVGTSNELTLTQGHFDLAHTAGGNPELVDISGTVAHSTDRLAALLTVALSQIDIADLPRLWPLSVATGARPWVVEHVTGGMATRGRASFAIEADDALRNIVLTKASGELDGSNGTFTWIDNMPPVEQTDFHLHLVDPDTLDIHVSSAHQRIRNGSPDLLIGDGQMRITGLSLRDQNAAIRVQVTGPVTSALALLKEPRLHLLSEHPIALKTAGGDASAKLNFQFPLENKLEVDDVQMHVDAHLSKVRLLDVAGGQGLDDGVFDLGIDKTGLNLKGQASVVGTPVALDGTMDFTPGPASQVVQKIAVSGQPDAARLDAAGLHIADYLTGPIPLTVVLIERRSGDSSVAINGDLTLAKLAVDPLAWSKPSGNIAIGSAILLMSHGRLTKIDKISLRGDGLLLSGSADVADSHIRTVRLDAIRLGRTQGHGTIHLAPNEPVAVVLQGNQIDLSAKLAEKTSSADRSDTQVTTPNWTLDARFDHAILANGEHAADVLAKATGGGQMIRLLDVVGASYAVPGQPTTGFSIKIEPRANKRQLLIEAKDAGSFLRGVDAIQGMRSGHLTINGILDRPFGLQSLSGTATIDNIVVKNSPVLGKLLQAITLYGLVDALGGPGMTFSQVVVPFQYDGTNLNIDEAHAANPSLGLTANGRINLLAGQTSLTGTIVPAYFFNSMLGHLPLVGKLFSPEKGGGVFAARFGVDGQITDPTISINPVSALTPGFLREIFAVFDRTPAARGDAEEKGK